MGSIYQRGKTWYVGFYLKGKRYRKRVGPSKQLAELALKDIEVKIIKGELGFTERKKVRFTDYANDYLAYSKTSKAKGSHRRDINSMKHLVAHFGDRYLDDVTNLDVEQYKTERYKKVKPTTVNRELACLRHMYNTAIRWNLVKENPVKGVKFAKELSRVRYLSQKEIQALFKECKGMLHAIVVTALNTGMRKGEIMRLRWTDVDFDNRTIKVTAEKTTSIRFIPINDPLFDELVLLPRNGEYVFSKEDGQPYGDCKKGFATALERAEINDFTFHDLRHTFASYLAMSGEDIRTIQELLGHKDIRVTVKYAHLSRDKLTQAVKILGTKWSQTPSVKIGEVVKSHE